MPRRFTTRSLCVLLVLSLCAPAVALAAPTTDLDREAEFRAVVAPSSTVLLTRAGARDDHARQRPSAPSVFTLVALHGGATDSGCLAGAVDRHAPQSLWIGGPRTGRSPPSIS